MAKNEGLNWNVVHRNLFWLKQCFEKDEFNSNAIELARKFYPGPLMEVAQHARRIGLLLVDLEARIKQGTKPGELERR